MPLVSSALTQTIVFSPTTVKQHDATVTPNDLRPAECANPVTGVSVARVAVGSTAGSSTNTLLLGDAATTAMTGGGGGDCIVGNSAVLTIDGGLGYNVCIGGMTTVFTNCAVEVRNP